MTGLHNEGMTNQAPLTARLRTEANNVLLGGEMARERASDVMLEAADAIERAELRNEGLTDQPDDLVDQLRRFNTTGMGIAHKAADEIERLRARLGLAVDTNAGLTFEVARLRAVLTEVAESGGTWSRKLAREALGQFPWPPATPADTALAAAVGRLGESLTELARMQCAHGLPVLPEGSGYACIACVREAAS